MSLQTYQIVAGDWIGLERIINDLTGRVVGQTMGPTSSPTFAGLTLTGLSGVLQATDGVLSGDADHNSLDTIQGGTTDEYYHLTSAEYSALGGFISEEVDPVFTGVLAGLTANRLIYGGTAGALTSVSNLASWIAGTTNQVTVTDDTDGTVTLSLPQDIHTLANVNFGSVSAAGGSLSSLSSNTIDVVQKITIDSPQAEALLVRKDGDAGDIFTVDAASDRVIIKTLTGLLKGTSGVVSAITDNSALWNGVTAAGTGFLKQTPSGTFSDDAFGTSTYIPVSNGTGFSYSENLVFNSNRLGINTTLAAADPALTVSSAADYPQFKLYPQAAFGTALMTNTLASGAGTIFISPNFALSNPPYYLWFNSGSLYYNLATFAQPLSGTVYTYYDSFVKLGIGYCALSNETIPQYFSVKNSVTGAGTMRLNPGKVITDGTTTLTGHASGVNRTYFLSSFQTGDTIIVSGETRTIDTIASNSSLTVTVAFTTSVTDVTYTGSQQAVGTSTTFTTFLAAGNVVRIEGDTALRTVNSVISNTVVRFTTAFGVANYQLVKYALYNSTYPDGFVVSNSAGNPAYVGINKTTPTVPLDVVGAILASTTITATTGFGCNGATAQTAYASGGAAPTTAGTFGFASDAERAALTTLVANIRLALVANGIMS